jgi:hypothetical protein
MHTSHIENSCAQLCCDAIKAQMSEKELIALVRQNHKLAMFLAEDTHECYQFDSLCVTAPVK